MASEQYSIGYEEGFQNGWNAAVDSLTAQRKPLTDEQWQVIADTLHCCISRDQKDTIEVALGITNE